MSDRNLRLQVVLDAVDKLTRPFKSAQAGSKELAAAIRQTREQLKQLSSAGGHIKSFDQMSQSLGRTSAELDQVRLRAQMMTREMSALESPTKKQTQALEAQWRAVSRLEQKQGQETRQMAAARAELYRLGISAGGGARETARIARETDRYNRQLAEQERRLREVGERQQKLNAIRARAEKTRGLRNSLAGNGASVMAAGVTTGMALLAPVRAYSESENAANQLAGSMMGPGGKVSAEFEKINKLAVALGDKLPGTTADFQNMMTMLRRQGMSAQVILGGLGESAAYLGVQLQMAPTAAAEFAAKLQDATQTSEKDMMNLMDLIQKGFYAGVDSGNMLQGFSNISSAMSIINQKGIEAAKTFAPLLVMSDQTGMAGESAGNAYRKIFQAALDSKNIQSVNDDLKGTGINFNFSNGKGGFGGLENMYSQLEKLNKLNDETRIATIKDLFGNDAEVMKVLNTMIEKGIKGYRETAAKLENQASLRERVDASLNTLGNKWEAATGSFTNAMASIGETVAPVLKNLADWLGGMASRLNGFVKQHPQLTSALFKLAAGFSIVATAAGVVSLALASVLGPLALLRFGMKSLALTGLGRLSPLLGRLGQAFTSLAPGFFQSGDALKKLFGLFSGNEAGETVSWISRIREALSGGEDDDGGILDAFRDGALDKIKEHAQQAGETLVSSFRNPGEAVRMLGAKIRGLASAAFAPLVNSVRGAGGVLRWLVMSPFALLRAALIGVGSVLGVLLSPIGLVVAALAGVALVVWKYWQPISGFLGGVVEGFKAAAGPISAAFEPLRPIFQWIGDKVQALWGWFTNLISPVKSTSDELSSAAAMGRRFGEELAAGLNIVMHPLESLKSGVSWLLEKLGIVSKEAAKARLPDQVIRQQSAAVNSEGRVMLPPGGFPAMGFAGMYDSGGDIPRGQFGIVGENGPEIINGPVNVTSRRRTAALASIVAGALGVAASAEAAPVHPYSRPIMAYKQNQVEKSAAGPAVMHFETHAPITIYAQPGQSSQDIAREVARQLDERERRMRARARSSFRDRGGFDE